MTLLSGQILLLYLIVVAAVVPVVAVVVISLLVVVVVVIAALSDVVSGLTGICLVQSFLFGFFLNVGVDVIAVI